MYENWDIFTGPSATSNSWAWARWSASTCANRILSPTRRPSPISRPISSPKLPSRPSSTVPSTTRIPYWIPPTGQFLPILFSVSYCVVWCKVSREALTNISTSFTQCYDGFTSIHSLSVYGQIMSVVIDSCQGSWYFRPGLGGKIQFEVFTRREMSSEKEKNASSYTERKEIMSRAAICFFYLSWFLEAKLDEWALGMYLM